jgi:hypothetical protein
MTEDIKQQLEAFLGPRVESRNYRTRQLVQDGMSYLVAATEVSGKQPLTPDEQEFKQQLHEMQFKRISDWAHDCKRVLLALDSLLRDRLTVTEYTEQVTGNNTCSGIDPKGIIKSARNLKESSK